MTRGPAIQQYLRVLARLGASAVGALLVASLPAQLGPELKRDGRDWIAEQSGQAPSGEELRVRSRGRVVVQGSPQDGIRYHATLRLGAAGDENWARTMLERAGVVSEQQPNGAVVLTLRDPACEACRFEARLDIEVPQATRHASISTRGGHIEARRIDGSVRAESTGGAIVLDDIGGEVSAETAGGGVRLGTIGGAARCETAGGSIALEHAKGGAYLKTRGGGIWTGRVEGDLHAETHGGSIEVGEVAGAVRASTAGGSIRIGKVQGSVQAATAGGSIRAEEAPQGVYAEAAAGDVRIENASGAVVVTSGAGDILASLLEGVGLQDSILETGVGSIVVNVPEALALTIEASVGLTKSLRGIVSEFPSIEVRRREEGFGPRAVTATGDINGGGARLRIRSNVGYIEIRRKR